MARVELVFSDLFISFLWVWLGSVLRVFACEVLGLGMHSGVGFVKVVLAVMYVSLFAWLGKATGGGSYNPLIVLCNAISHDFLGFLFAVFARIPAQVIGSVIGVSLTKAAFPEASYGPRLNVDIHRGALTEGLLTLLIVITSVGMKKIGTKNLVMRTWISSISKVAFHLLGSDVTGGIMNPATAFGWAYAQGDHMSKEHLLVYWLAPIEGTLLAVWACTLLSPGSSRISRTLDSKQARNISAYRSSLKISKRWCTLGGLGPKRTPEVENRNSNFDGAQFEGWCCFRRDEARCWRS